MEDKQHVRRNLMTLLAIENGDFVLMSSTNVRHIQLVEPLLCKKVKALQNVNLAGMPDRPDSGNGALLRVIRFRRTCC